jgi:polysaccharide export outer membrane protein
VPFVDPARIKLMRQTRVLAAVALTLALGGCLHQQAATYVIDPATGQPVPVVQSYAQPQYAQQQYAQQQYTQQQYAQPQYAQQQYAQPAYQQQQQPARSGERGLLTSRHYAAPVYAPPQAQQPYVMQYAPQQPPQQQYAPAPQYGAQYPAQYNQAYAAAPYGYAYAPAQQQPYTLDSGDRLRIVVFGQDGISNSYIVDAGGNVNLPLIGVVPARGATTQQLSQVISERLKQGYVREPHVSVEVETYRPFFILGEVTNPGQYPYVANMTAETAVAIAGGFAPRASKSSVKLSRNAPGQQFSADVPLRTPLRPGDTVIVKERWF